MTASLWLAWRELWARRKSLVMRTALIAAAVALVSATELVSRAREAAVAAQIDYLGPTLRLVPAGVTSTELARFELGDTLVPERTVAQLRSAWSPWLRASEARLLLTAPVDAVRSPIIGVSPDDGVASLVHVRDLPPDEVLLGADLARRLGKAAGDRVGALDRRWRVHGVLPPLGTSEDLAAVLRLSTLQEARGAGRGINEMRLYAKPGVRGDELATRLRAAHPELSVVGGADRGAAAERRTVATLRGHRRVVYGLTALAAGLALMIAAHLNAAERRVEMAMLVAMGGTRASVLATLAASATIVGVAGAVVGCALGAGIALAQDVAAGVAMGWSWTLPVLAIGAAATLSVVAALPVSARLSYQDHVRALQE